jgi:hypothetical protein
MIKDLEMRKRMAIIIDNLNALRILMPESDKLQHELSLIYYQIGEFCVRMSDYHKEKII